MPDGDATSLEAGSPLQSSREEVEVLEFFAYAASRSRHGGADGRDGRGTGRLSVAPRAHPFYASGGVVAMTFSGRALLVPVLCSWLSWPGSSAAGEDPPAERRVSLRGYDPVSYFVDGKPAKGSRKFWYSFDDAVYLFRSSEHRATFAADPERYAPQYQGYCAAGVSDGHKAEPDPEAWLIANGKLFVFERKDRLPEFRKRIGELAARANANWPTVKQQ